MKLLPNEWILIISLSLFFLIPCTSFPQTQPTIFINAKIYPISGEPIENGYLHVHNGKIVEAGNIENLTPGKKKV